MQRPRVRQPGPHRAREEPDRQTHQRDVGVQDRGDNPRPRSGRGLTLYSLYVVFISTPIRLK